MTSSSWRRNSKSKKITITNMMLIILQLQKLLINMTLFLAEHRKDFEISQQLSKIEDEQAIGAQLQKKLKELQVTIMPLKLCCPMKK